MVKEFERDLAIGKEAEEIVMDVVSALRSDLTLVDISGDFRYYHTGDIAAIDKKNNKIYFIEVKNDSRIADTGNVLCEEEVYYKKKDYYGKGNMYSNADVFAIVSKQNQKIYFIDFKVLKKNYTKGTYKKIEHPAQDTHCFLCDLGRIKQWGGLIDEINYREVQVA